MGGDASALNAASVAQDGKGPIVELVRTMRSQACKYEAVPYLFDSAVKCCHRRTAKQLPFFFIDIVSRRAQSVESEPRATIYVTALHSLASSSY